MFTKYRRTLIGLLTFMAIWFFIASLFTYFETENWEGMNFKTALYWALVTMTTVGYGDFFPKNEVGRLLTFGVAGGVGVVALSTVMGAVTNALAGRKELKRKGYNKLVDENHVIILGYTNFSEVQRLIDNLKTKKVSRIVLIDDQLEENPFLTESRVIYVKAEDADWEGALLKANIQRCSECYLLVNENTLNTRAITLSGMVRNLSPATKIISQLVDPSELEMQLIQADGIMPVKTLEADLTFMTSEKPNSVIPLVSLISSSDNAEVFEVTVPEIIKPNTTVSDIKRTLRKRFIYKPLCKMNHKVPDFSMDNDTVVEPGEVLVFLKISS